ncbi:DUF4179 domain-containing protein [Saccharibacillus endophyticus]|uniref:DUF4179 domain-containing protein n=1 Tax=Saccharibacillus endophyticus TaxID=2060666 RepID=A0ABQ1ZXK5_9BACL|nr:DUF4179 domain-containing protein [Saccharibacillus endophyticus]GGH81896.1 hypothetical protein GCM10007362_32390 [Saccharibacillus endophyticus]
MTHHEEQKLLRDAEQSERESRHIGGTELSDAVRQGIGKGKKRASRRRTAYGTGTLAAAAAVVIALSASLLPGGESSPAPSAVTAGVQSDPAAAGQPETSDEDSGYLSIDDYRSVGMETKFFNAINRGHMKAIGEKQEKDGYTLTLKGAALDKRKMYVVAELRNDSDRVVRLTNPLVSFDNVQAVSWSLSNGEVLPPGGSKYLFIENKLASGIDDPDQAVFHAEAYAGEFGDPKAEEISFDIPFELDAQDLLDDTRTVEVGRELTIDGQRIEIQRVMLSPLGTYVDYAYADTNTKHVFSLNSPNLKVSSEKSSESPAFQQNDQSENGQRTLIFSAVLNSLDADSIVLSAEGIAALDPEQLKLVVDTEKGRILQGGDSTLSVSADPKERAFTFEQDMGEYSEENHRDASQISFEDTVVDAEGRTYSLPYAVSGTTEQVQGRLIDKSTYRIEEKDVVQPITFTISNYWNTNKEQAELELLR